MSIALLSSEHGVVDGVRVWLPATTDGGYYARYGEPQDAATIEKDTPAPTNLVAESPEVARAGAGDLEEDT